MAKVFNENPENNKINVVYTSDSKEIITKSDLIENRFSLAESVVR